MNSTGLSIQCYDLPAPTAGQMFVRGSAAGNPRRQRSASPSHVTAWPAGRWWKPWTIGSVPETDMKPILAILERHPDGVLSGLFRTLSIRSQIEIRPATHDQGGWTYLVVASPDFLLGHGRQQGDSGSAPIELCLRAPELPSPVHARVMPAEGERWIMLWMDP